MSCPRRDDAGPWVLRALDEPDARAFAAHLETCETCRAEVAELRGVADVLPMAAPQVAPPAALRDRIMATVEAEAELLRAASPHADRPPATPPARPRRRWLGPLLRLRPIPAVALASVVLAVGIAAGVLLSGGQDTTTHRGFGPAGAEVALRVTGDHGELDLSGMPSPPAGRVYQVWLVHGHGRPRPTHTLFTVARDGRAQVDIMESLHGTDRVLVTAEPSGGSRQPTSAPVAGATLA